MDVTGEPAFLARLHADHGPRAASSGVSLLPAVGYELSIIHISEPTRPY